MTNLFKLSPKFFYRYHSNELNKYKKKENSVLHVINKDITYENLGDDEEVLAISISENFDYEMLENRTEKYDLIVVTDIFDITNDVMKLIIYLEKACKENGKIIFSNLNSIWHPVFKVFEILRLKKQSPKRNKISPKKMISVAKGANLELINSYTRLFLPFYLFGFGLIINQLLEILFFKFNFGMKFYSVFRKGGLGKNIYSKTVIIPAKNEEGNLEELIERINLEKSNLQIIFCIGRSNDRTYEKANELTTKYKDIDFHLFAQKSNGKGKGVFESFQYVKNDLVVILDSDLSVDPEELTNVFRIIENGTADFVNCTRLIYKMEKGAMRALNNFMNSFFPIMISFITGVRFTDTLCGTKAFNRDLIEKIFQWNKEQKNIDPFGDFDMLFTATYFGEKVAEYPVNYRSRRYGKTQIHRFRDGLKLILYLLVSIFNLNVSKK